MVPNPLRTFADAIVNIAAGALTLGEISPPAGGNCPQTEADFAHRQFSIFVSAKTHRSIFTAEDAEVTENIFPVRALCGSAR